MKSVANGPKNSQAPAINAKCHGLFKPAALRVGNQILFIRDTILWPQHGYPSAGSCRSAHRWHVKAAINQIPAVSPSVTSGQSAIRQMSADK